MKKLIVLFVMILPYQLLFSQEKDNTFNLKTDDINKGIVIFSLENCSRCETAKKYFDNNKIDYKLITTTNNKEANSLLWNLIQQKEATKMRVKYPVIVVNGKLNYDIKKLNQFLNNL